MSTILLTGATGFIGSRLADALTREGHRVIRAGRTARGEDAVAIDFNASTRSHHWTPALHDVDIVINAVGIIRERGGQTFDRLHTQAPAALFRACVAAGVERVVQISALGAADGTTAYFRSKREADDFLATLPLDWCVVRPSLVYGINGGSAQLFDMLASLPIIPLPGDGRQAIQPIHVDDLVAAVVELVQRPAPIRQIIPIVGPHPTTLREFLESLRSGMGLRRTVFLPVPLIVMRVAAAAGDAVGSTILGRDTLAMLARGNIGDGGPVTALLQRPPRAIQQFIEPQMRRLTFIAARSSWLLPLLRFSIAAVWLWTGVVSLGLYPTESSYELLARTGLHGAPAAIALYGAALLDIALGVGTLVMKRRRTLWLAQMLLIVAYSVLISMRLPEFWLHPYGPLLKNLPMLAGIFLLYALEEPQWNTSS